MHIMSDEGQLCGQDLGPKDSLVSLFSNFDICPMLKEGPPFGVSQSFLTGRHRLLEDLDELRRRLRVHLGGRELSYTGRRRRRRRSRGRG